jgi:mono/diheme cytochrome c family protein
LSRGALVVTLGLAAVAAVAAGCGGGSGRGPGSADRAAAVARGATVYSGSCAACHGPAGEGVTDLGPALSGNAFVAARGDDEVVAFLAQGRPASDPANTTGIDMPARGGDPSLTDADLRDLVAYLRSLARH